LKKKKPENPPSASSDKKVNQVVAKNKEAGSSQIGAKTKENSPFSSNVTQMKAGKIKIFRFLFGKSFNNFCVKINCSGMILI
jgi:hypothetical protein